MKIGIISHTEHFINRDGEVVGWAPTVKELNKLSSICDELVHMAPLYKGFPERSTQTYQSDKISFVPLVKSGGKGIVKLSILFTAPINIWRIYKQLKSCDKVQFRAPTGMGIYILPFLKVFATKKYWVKYAGNWKDPKMPLGNKLQKWWLQNRTANYTKITVNGTWSGERNNVIPFENPCIDADERSLGQLALQSKSFDKKINFCFVGALNTHKGIDKIIEVFREISNSRIGLLHIVGEGSLKEKLIAIAAELRVSVKFHGILSKKEINKIYTQSHFILLPSKSEGFPKVIGEAMNFGCIPIVSDVSCISDYVRDNENGFLLNPITEKELLFKINESLKIDPKILQKWSVFNYQLAEKFTFEYFLQSLKTKVLSVYNEN